MLPRFFKLILLKVPEFISPAKPPEELFSLLKPSMVSKAILEKVPFSIALQVLLGIYKKRHIWEIAIHQ